MEIKTQYNGNEIEKLKKVHNYIIWIREELEIDFLCIIEMLVDRLSLHTGYLKEK